MKKLGKIPQHKKLAITGKPYKKGGAVTKSHEAKETAAYERKEEKCAKGYKHGGYVKKKGHK